MPKKLDSKAAEKVMLSAGLKPLEPYKSSSDKWTSRHIKCGKTVYPSYDKIRSGQSGCRACAYKENSEKRRLDFKTSYSIMLKANLKPLEPYKNANEPWQSECIKCGAVISPTLASVKKGGGCKFCSSKRGALKKRLPEKKAVTTMIRAGLKPLAPYKGANVPWRCRCTKCKKIVNPSYASIQQGGGCEYCSKTKIDTKDAVKIMMNAKLKPLEVYKTSNTKWKCLHLVCGQIVYPRYSDVQQGTGGCNLCAKRNAIVHKRISEKNAIALMLKNKMKPMEPFIDTNTKWKCKCLVCKKISYPRYAAVNMGHTCTYCSGNKVDEKDAIRLMLRSKLRPLEKYKSANVPWKCKCLKCGKTVKPRYSSITVGQGGCRFCSVKGINMNTPSYVYLITHYELNAHKIGMGNHKPINDRLGRFIKDGWLTFKVWHTSTGSEAIDIETEALRILRKELALPVYLTKADMPKTEGHTETVNADSITLLELESIVKGVIKGHRR